MTDIDLRLRYKQRDGDILTSNTVQSINESISQIIETSIGSRLFNRGFGSNLKSLLFEPMNEITADFILMSVSQSLSRFEPRVSLLLSQSEILVDYDNNLYELRLVYNIASREEVGEFSTFIESQTR